MGTRCLTVVLDDVWEKDGKKPKKREECLVMYRQFDGYPEGHGQELARFLAAGVPTNGLSGMNQSGLFNGAGCMAASIVCHFKQQPEMLGGFEKVDGEFKHVERPNPNAHKPAPGGFYLHPSGTRDVGEEYIYYVEIKEDAVLMTVCEAAWTEKDYSKKGHPIIAEHDEHVLWSGNVKDFETWLAKRDEEKEAKEKAEAK